MFTTPAPSAPTISTTTSPASPTTAGRSGRLRGLSYLRNYTQSHLHARSDSEGLGRTRPPFSRARSQPSSDNKNTREEGASAQSGGERSPRSPSPNSGTTSGWLPTVAGRSGVSRVSTRQQNASTESASAEPAPAITTSASSVPAPRAMARTRAETAAPVLTSRQNTNALNASNQKDSSVAGQNLPSIRFIPHFDPRATRPSLSFPAITRTLPNEHAVIKVGRYSERENMPEANPSAPSAAPVGFKSKVVSRRHCEFWCQNNQWFIKDVKSSSGTFLNHLRLSPPGVESKPWPVNDGDVVQLGIDFRGGEEMIFRCVKIRIECNRGWQKGLNNFNKSTHKHLQNLGKKKDSDAASVNSSECSICLMSIAPCQSLFVAPCSHVWHYKCIRPILNGHTWPNFLCPNCRAVADLEADVDEAPDEWEEEDEAIEASKKELKVTKTDAASLNSTRAVHRVPSRDTPEPMDAQGADHDTDEDLNLLVGLNNLALSQPPAETPPTSDESNPPGGEGGADVAVSSHSLSTPRAIPSRNGSTSSRPGQGTSPERTVARDVLLPVTVTVEGPMTPRNDAGPFVLDGGAGRSARAQQEVQQET